MYKEWDDVEVEKFDTIQAMKNERAKTIDALFYIDAISLTNYFSEPQSFQWNSCE